MTGQRQDARPPGMQDVARLAGVSHQTVSRVLNAHPNVRPETRERVQAAIAQLGYRRNSAARALVTRRSETIGVVTLGTGMYGPTSTFQAVEWAARDAGYFVSVASLRDPDAPSMIRAIDHFSDQAVEGLVVIAPMVSVAEAAAVSGIDVPVVLVAADVTQSAGFHALSVDQEAGARLAVRHLIDLGHREIAHITGPEDWFDSVARIRGWEVELAERGLSSGETYAGDWSPERGYELGQRIVRHGLPDAVFAANDQTALGLLWALIEAGVRVPEDISVVGFDDISGAAYYAPPLTTVRQDFEALGRGCMRILARAMQGPRDDLPVGNDLTADPTANPAVALGRAPVPDPGAAPGPDPGPILPTLVVRASTGPVRAGRS